jgi:hypothetical protein
MRGGRRPQFAPRHELRVFASCQRGRRRVRVTECWSVLRAEDLYTALIRDRQGRTQPGARGTSTFTVGGRTLAAPWEVRQNALWRFGRVFLRCERCALRCTRLYVPLETSDLACRRCWGLTYASRTLNNYKDSVWGRGAIARMFGTTQRDWAFQTTADRRDERRKAAQTRRLQRLGVDACSAHGVKN